MGRKIGVSVSTATLAFFIFILVLPKQILAYHQVEVLGESSIAATPQIAPTTEGPGLILPDSPLFFLDQIKQNIRLFFAFTPEAKAKVYTDIAGERLAELRFMLAKNHEKGIKIALEGVSGNLQEAAVELSNAKLFGKNVSALAKTINISIKEKQETLDILDQQTKGELKARVKVSKVLLKEAKVEVEDALSQDELENEIEDDLENEIDDSIKEASESAKGLTHAIDVLSKLASQAAEKQQLRREVAIRHAIEVKNDALRIQEEKLLEKDMKKQQELLKAQEKAGVNALEAIRKSQEAAQKFREAQEKVKEIKNTSGSSESSSGHNESGGSSGGDN